MAGPVVNNRVITNNDNNNDNHECYGKQLNSYDDWVVWDLCYG